MINELKDTTGKSFEEWKELIAKTGLEKHTYILNHLRNEYGVSYGYANFIGLKIRGTDAGSYEGAELVTKQYTGKEDLKSIYEEVLGFCTSLGEDVEVAPKIANVSVRRKKQFVLIQPSTKTRIDLGIKLRDQKPEGKLEPSGPFGTMCTHRIKISSLEDLNDEVKNWILKAYNEAN